MDFDHPKETLSHGCCSRCHYPFSFAVLEPRPTINKGIVILCPGCRMEQEAGCKEQ